MRIRALVCAALLCSALWSPAGAARWDRAPGTTFEAETKGAPVAAMTGHWQVDGRSARLVFGGAQLVGDKTHMKATWTTRFGPKIRSPRVTVECNRVSGSMEDKPNRWSVEILIVPKAGFGRGAFAYRTRLTGPEVASGEGVSESVQSFRPQRWKYHVTIEADLVTASELSGTCTMEAR